MPRLLAALLLALGLTLLVPAAAGAEQYPPTGERPTPTTAAVHDEPPAGEAPLARTGTDVTLLAGVALVLLAGGATAVVATRRRPAT